MDTPLEILYNFSSEASKVLCVLAHSLGRKSDEEDEADMLYGRICMEGVTLGFDSLA